MLAVRSLIVLSFVDVFEGSGRLLEGDWSLSGRDVGNGPFSIGALTTFRPLFPVF